MADIIDLSAEREARAEHLSGSAHCLDCGHKWEAVAPIETRWLECPGCHGERGTWRGHCTIEERYVCNCGNDLYQIGREFTQCVACGARIFEWPM